MTEPDDQGGAPPGDLYQRVVEAAPDAVVCFGPDGDIRYANSQAEALFGYARGALAGHHVGSLVPGLAGGPGPLGGGSRAGGRQRLRARGRDGTEFPVDVALAATPTAEGPFVTAFVRAAAAGATAEGLAAALERRDRQAQALNQFRDLLLVCLRPGEAYDVLAASAAELFPAHAGLLSVIQPSRDRAEAVAAWGGASTAQGGFSLEQCWALRLGRLYVSGGAPPRCGHLDGTGAARCVCAPMVAMGETIGAMHLLSPAAPGPAAPGADGPVEELATAVSSQLAAVMANLAVQERLRDLSIRDPLTNLFNRRYMEATLTHEVARARRDAGHVSFLQVDVDHFKAYNDAHGHDAGDAVLQAIAVLLVGYFRGSDVACRYGGEEFSVVLPDADAASSEQRARGLQGLVARTPVRHGRAVLEPPTLSVGVASFPEHASNAAALVKAADSALYTAKAAGRDRVEVAPLDLTLDWAQGLPRGLVGGGAPAPDRPPWALGWGEPHRP
jgi:diguanylate cyclase (GGDEF)-like protein/PAS domain S-box-containing protein